MYGTRLTRDFGESVPEVWKQAIAKLKAHEIQRGLNRLTAGGSGSVPTLPQFVKACKLVGGDEGPENPGPYQALPKPPFCQFKAFANHVMFNFLGNNGAASEDSLQFMIAEKNRLTDVYKSIQAEDHVDAQDFRDALHKSFKKLWQPMGSRKAA